jgi:hypothetical protein
MLLINSSWKRVSTSQSQCAITNEAIRATVTWPLQNEKNPDAVSDENSFAKETSLKTSLSRPIGDVRHIAIPACRRVALIEASCLWSFLISVLTGKETVLKHSCNLVSRIFTKMWYTFAPYLQCCINSKWVCRLKYSPNGVKRQHSCKNT